MEGKTHDKGKKRECIWEWAKTHLEIIQKVDETVHSNMSSITFISSHSVLKCISLYLEHRFNTMYNICNNVLYPKKKKKCTPDVMYFNKYSKICIIKFIIFKNMFHLAWLITLNPFCSIQTELGLIRMSPNTVWVIHMLANLNYFCMTIF